MVNTSQCEWKDCNGTAKEGFMSFDPLLISKDNLSVLVAYCPEHLDKILSGEFEEPYKPHQEFFYLNKENEKSRRDGSLGDKKIRDRMAAMFKLYGC
jgi:hypothetical protein